MPDAQIKTSQLFDDFAEDLLSERSVRPLIIIGVAKIEQLLLGMLNTFLLPKRVKAKEQDELLEGDTPLGTFSARIKICHRLGLIDETLCATLELLRKIRNLCAHSVSFDHTKSPVREHLTEEELVIFDILTRPFRRDQTLAMLDFAYTHWKADWPDGRPQLITPFRTA